MRQMIAVHDSLNSRWCNYWRRPDSIKRSLKTNKQTNKLSRKKNTYFSETCLRTHTPSHTLHTSHTHTHRHPHTLTHKHPTPTHPTDTHQQKHPITCKTLFYVLDLTTSKIQVVNWLTGNFGKEWTRQK